MANPATPYVETELLLAVMEANDERFHELLADMQPSEVERFYQQVSVLRHMLQEVVGRTLPKQFTVTLMEALEREARHRSMRF